MRLILKRSKVSILDKFENIENNEKSIKRKKKYIKIMFP